MITNEDCKVIIAMSGGVDSSVAAALLVNEGYDVIGVMLELWSDPSSENLCCTPESMALAQRVTDQLEIPFYTLDAKQAFRGYVVESFFETYKQGGTPNPCIICNRKVRWEILLSAAEKFGASKIATGHYARLQTEKSGRVQLLRGLDMSKDQSYVLHGLPQTWLSRTLFPLGKFQKTEIREIARKFSLPVADRPDSQDLCFVGNRGYRDFLIKYWPDVIDPGPILSISGEKLGEHQGLAFYTIGQRKGLRISAKEPYYVLQKDVTKNIIYVGTKDELGRDELTMVDANWISGIAPKESFRAQVKIRYKAADAWATVIPIGKDIAKIKFEKKLRDITPGQAAVLYDGEICLGGGTIV